MHGIQQEELSEQLLHAVISGNIEETEGLIKSGASVHSVNQHNKTLLHCAAEKGFEKITGLLLNRGANVYAINESKATALHFAAQGGHEGVIKLLLEEKAYIDEVEEEYGLAPLHYAARSGYTDAVRLLLEQGASINLVDYGGCTPLHYAAKNGHEDVVELLLEWKSAVNTIDCNGKVPKDYATKRGFQKIVSLLADKEKNANNLVSQSRLMPLYLAILEKNEGIVEFLIKTEGVNVNEIDQKYGDSPLHCAVKNNDPKMVKLLLTAESIDVNVVEKDGRTPLHHAAQRGYMNLVEYLIKREANVNAVDNFKNTPLHLIAHSGYIQDNGAWINIEEAAKLCHKNTVELLLKKGANINATNSQMQTPLHIAAEGGYSYLVEVLLKKGAAVNLVDNEGNTPLHCVGDMDGGEDDEEVIKLLLKAGADVNLVNAEGDTPLSGYNLESCHFNAGMKLIIDHVKKLQAAKFPINQKNKHFMGELVKEDYFLYAFLKENNTDVLLEIWEKNEYTRNKFIGKDLNEEKKLKKVLKERYLKYADTLIDKADKVRKKIFLHNNKLLLDPLSAHYQCNFKDMTFIDIRSFFDAHKEDFKEKLGFPLLDLIDLSDVRKNIPMLKVQVFAEIVRNAGPSRGLNSPNTEQHRSNPLTNQYT